MKDLLYYYLALLTWIAIIFMCASIVLIPVYCLLRHKSCWWQDPFGEASWYIDI